MKKVYFLPLILWMVTTSISSAAINPDSLKQAAARQRDSTLADTYLLLARYYFQTDHQPDSMIKYAQLSARTAGLFELDSRILKGKKALGLAYTEAGKFELAENAYSEAMAIAKQMNNVTEIIAINNKLGYLFGVANDLTKSAFYYLNTAKEFEKLGDFRNLGLTYKNVVVIFTLQEQPKKIMEYTKASLALVSKLDPVKDADIIVSLYSSAAQHYLLLGDTEQDPPLIDAALAYADSCLRIARNNNIVEGLADAYYVASHGYRLKKDWKNAILFADKALAYKGSIPNRTVFMIYRLLGHVYLDRREFTRVQQYIDTLKALPAAKELDAPLSIAQLRYHLYKEMGNDKEALEALEVVNVENKKLQDSERSKTINELESKYQNELKEAKISELNQQKNIDSLQIRSLLAFVGIAILVIIVIIFLYRQSIVRNKLNALEAEQRLNRARMNPHFFFNALTSLQHVALRQSNGQGIASSLSQFAKVMRTTLESTYHEYITLEKEIDFLNEYVAIQTISYPSGFAFSVNVSPSLEIHEVVIPSMILQPFVENSIEHGLSGLEGGRLIVEIDLVSGELEITITDNGKGLSTDQQSKKGHISRATEIIKDRIYLLNTARKSNARYCVGPNPGGQGVEIKIFLPLMYKHEDSSHRQRSRN